MRSKNSQTGRVAYIPKSGKTRMAAQKLKISRRIKVGLFVNGYDAVH